MATVNAASRPPKPGDAPLTSQSADAPVPQPVLSPLTETAIFLVMTAEPGGESEVRDLLSDLPALQRTVGFRVPGGGLDVVAGIGSSVWDRLYSGPRPAELRPFKELRGLKHRAVSTSGDLLFHIRAHQMDLCFELASQVMDRISDVVTVVEEVHGFKYFEVRDLLGFVDGTENPVGPDASAAVSVGAEDPLFAGSSYVVVQKYLHDLDAWNALSVQDQELVIGRTKLSNVEFPDDVKPSNSHVALNTIVAPDGTQMQVLRDNMPFGSLENREFGTYYIAYSSSPRVSEEMLEHMFIGDPPGNYDRILDFSKAVSGAQFFVPTIDFLENPPPAPGDSQPSLPAVPKVDATPSEDSLGIGGLVGPNPT
jgi:porphyrinogen peroxidase